MPKYDSGIGPDRAVYGPQGSHITYETAGLGSIVTIANGLFAAVIIAALWRGDTGVVAAIVTGGLYYGVTTLAALLILSGTLAQVATSRQEQITLRQYHVLQSERATLPVADPLRTLAVPSATPVPAPGGSSYVSPVNDSDYREALAYVAQLYDADGRPDARKIVLDARDARQTGRLRIAAPSRDALDWLVSRDVLQPILRGGSVNGYALRLDLCPTLSAAHAAMRQRHPVLPPSGGYGG